MDKVIKEMVDLNGTLSISVIDSSIIMRVYQSHSNLRSQFSNNPQIDFSKLPHNKGDTNVVFQSDIFEVPEHTIKIKGLKDYYIKSIFVWLLEQGLPYLAGIARETKSEIVIVNSFSIERGVFESYAALGEDLPVLLLSITKQMN